MRISANSVAKSGNFPQFLFWAVLFSFAFFIHWFNTFSLGFISDDYAILESVQNGTLVWRLHYSPIMEYLWRCTANGYLNETSWRVIALGFHTVNVYLVYLIAKRNPFPALLFALSPAGIEAIAWNCSLGYVITCTWLLTAIYLHLHFKSRFILALIQLLAFFTWDWAVVITPILFVFDRSRKELILPSLVWIVGVYLRVTSSFETGWQHNTFSQIISYLGGTPFLGLFPNFDKGFYSSQLGIFLALILLGVFFRNRFILCFYISIFPWIIGANLSSRYLYIPMAFLYLSFTIRKPIIIGLIIISQFIFTYDRATLWKMAYQESQKIKKVFEQESYPKVVINLPDAYGPKNLTMRPQMWFCGFRSLFPDVKVLKIPGCDFIWFDPPKMMTREDIVKRYPSASEIVYENPSDWRRFLLSKTDIEVRTN